MIKTTVRAFAAAALALLPRAAHLWASPDRPVSRLAYRPQIVTDQGFRHRHTACL